MTQRIRWEDPPPPLGGRSQDRVHADLAARLRKRPRQWGMIGTYARANTAASTAQMIRNARLGAYGPAGTYEAVARTVGGEHRVYARYAPKAEGDE